MDTFSGPTSTSIFLVFRDSYKHREYNYPVTNCFGEKEKILLYSSFF